MIDIEELHITIENDKELLTDIVRDKELAQKLIRMTHGDISIGDVRSVNLHVIGNVLITHVLSCEIDLPNIQGNIKLAVIKRLPECEVTQVKLLDYKLGDLKLYLPRGSHKPLDIMSILDMIERYKPLEYKGPYHL